MKKRLGLWGARMDNTGLGQQTQEFFLHMEPKKTAVVDISEYEANPNRRMVQYPERYKLSATIGSGDPNHHTVVFRNGSYGDVRYIKGFPNEQHIREFLADLDVVFIAESSYNMAFYQIAREMGVKVANQYNYEFFDWYPGSVWQTQMPDLFIAPSTWEYEQVNTWIDEANKKTAHQVRHCYLPCPINRDKIKRRNIDSVHMFVHIAGRPADHDRNGTGAFLEAINLSDGELKGVVYTQDPSQRDLIRSEYPSIDVRYNVKDYQEMYKKGSVLVLPRKYGGNCLPMNEALGAGMPVIMSKVSPQTDFLPQKWLVEAELAPVEFAPRFPLQLWDVAPHNLFLRMKWFETLSPVDMREHSDKANELAESISWETLKPKYEEVLDAICLL